MIESLSRNWWMLALRGLFAILFGVVALVWPGSTLFVLVLLFGSYVLVDGVLAIVAAFRYRELNDRWWVLLLEGLAGIVAGVLTFVWPEITAIALLYVIAAWALLTGIFEIAAAIRLRRELEGEWLMILSGIVSVLLAVALVLLPGVALTALVWVIGGYAIVFGALLIYLGFRMRGLGAGHMGGQRQALT